MGHRNERNVDARSNGHDDDDREERDRLGSRHAQEAEHGRRKQDDDDDDREERDRFVNDADAVRELIQSMSDADRAPFIDERTRMFDDEERGRLFGGNVVPGTPDREQRARERPRPHNGSSRFHERHRRR